MKTKPVFFIFLMLLLCGCKDLTEIHQTYLDRGEIIYLARPDTVTAGQGYQKIQLKWNPGVNQEIEGTVIYWNDRTDSLVHAVTSIRGKEAVVISNLQERIYVFELVNLASNGIRSLPTEVSKMVLGEEYVNALFPATFTYAYDETETRLVITWGKTDETLRYSRVKYTALSDGSVKEVVWSPSDGTITVIDDFDAGTGKTLEVCSGYRPDGDAFEDFESGAKVIVF